MSDILPFVEDTSAAPVSGVHSHPSGAHRDDISRLPPKPDTSRDARDAARGGDGTATTAAEPSTNPREINALSFDQVNDNADELIELRGEGRYFGVTDPSTGTTINSLQSLGPLCGNCHKRGHVRAKCKTVVCHKCGVVGDHYETQCPTTMICSKCGLKGHIAMNCTNKVRKRQYCKNCDTFSHGDDTCPSIWRSYITLPTPPEEEHSTVLPAIYCYNCGDKNHYGDECPRMRSSRVPNPTGSAFTGSNLPRHLREVYFDRLKRGSKNTKPAAPSYRGSEPIRLAYIDGKIQQEPAMYGKPSFDYNYDSRNYDANSNNSTYNSTYNNSYGNNYNNNYNNNFAGNYNNNNYSNNNNNYNNNNSNYSNNYSNNNYNNYNNTSRPNPSRSGYLDSSNNPKSSNFHNNSKNTGNKPGYNFPTKPSGRPSGRQPSSQQPQPNRSGFIGNNGSKNSKSSARPTRSGLIESSGKAKKQKKNMNMMY